MRISSFIIMMVLIGAVIVGVYSFAEDLQSNYGVDINTSYKTTFNKIDLLQNKSAETQGRILNITSKEDKSFFTGTWDAFKITKEVTVGAADVTTSSIGIANSLLLSFTESFGLGGDGNYIYTVMITLLTISIIGALIFLIVKRSW